MSIIIDEWEGCVDLNRPLAVVTPTLDGDALARLAVADEAFTPGQLQRMIPDASVDGIRRALNRLAAQGIVTAAPVGAVTITYRLNRDHVAADAVVQLAQLWGSALQRIEDALGRWAIPPLYAAVFGSWARREAAATSDLDLFVVRPDDAAEQIWDEQVAEIQDRATRWTGNDTRVLVLDESQVTAKPDDPVLASVLRDGRTVGGDREWFRRVVTPGGQA